MMVASVYGEALKVWKRSEEEDAQVCSYEDTILHYPNALREGQCAESASKDFERLEVVTQTLIDKALAHGARDDLTVCLFEISKCRKRMSWTYYRSHVTRTAGCFDLRIQELSLG